MKVVVISTLWPEPTSSAAGSRMLQILRLFREEGYTITYASTAGKSQYAVSLESLDITPAEITLNDDSFDHFITNECPDIVLYDRFMAEEQFGWRVAKHCPQALRILDSEDLHCLRAGRQQAHKESKAFTTDYLQSDIAYRELASIYRSDLTLIISKVEMELLQSYFKVPSEVLHYLPFLLETISKAHKDALPTYIHRAHFVTIGNFLHAPNWDATLYLKNEIWPLIREELPEVQMHVYGAYASQKVQQLNAPKDGFYCKGRAEHAAAVVRNAKVLLAPLRFGAGLKGKIIEAMQQGTPVITTPMGAEGMFTEDNAPGYIAHTAQAFANYAVQAYREGEQWEVFQNNGFTVLDEEFSYYAFAKTCIAKIKAVQQDLKSHRTANFTGLMLQHHTMQSTKYLSKWIQEKNKLN